MASPNQDVTGQKFFYMISVLNQYVLSLILARVLLLYVRSELHALIGLTGMLGTSLHRKAAHSLILDETELRQCMNEYECSYNSMYFGTL